MVWQLIRDPKLSDSLRLGHWRWNRQPHDDQRHNLGLTSNGIRYNLQPAESIVLIRYLRHDLGRTFTGPKCRMGAKYPSQRHMGRSFGLTRRSSSPRHWNLCVSTRAKFEIQRTIYHRNSLES